MCVCSSDTHTEVSQTESVEVGNETHLYGDIKLTSGKVLMSGS